MVDAKFFPVRCDSRHTSRATTHIESVAVVTEWKSSGVLDRIIIGIKSDEDRERLASWIASTLIQLTMSNATSAVDAASIVFGHSVVDEGISELLEITMITAPEFWETRVAPKQVTLGELRSSSDLSALVSDKIAKELKSIRRNLSLLKRADLLNTICKPQKPPLAHYTYDREKLREIDRTRQDIVHGELANVSIDAVDDKLMFLQDTGYHFFLTLSEAFGVKIDPSKF